MAKSKVSPKAKAGPKTTGARAAKAGSASRSDERKGGMRALAATLPDVTRRAFGRRGLAEAGLIAQWPEIVGQELAAVCVPRRIAFPRRDKREEGVLTLRVASGHALAVQHLEPLILGRISSHFGYLAVTRLRLEQGPLPAPRRPRSPPRRPLPPKALEALDGRIDALGDPDLAAAFRRLGRALLESGDDRPSKES